MLHSRFESRGYLKLSDVWKVHGKVFHLESRHEAKWRNVFHPRKLAIVDFSFIDCLRFSRLLCSRNLQTREWSSRWKSWGSANRVNTEPVLERFVFAPHDYLYFHVFISPPLKHFLVVRESRHGEIHWKAARSGACAIEIFLENFPSRWKSFVQKSRIGKALWNGEFLRCFHASLQLCSFKFRDRPLSPWTFLKKPENLKFFTSASRHSNFHFLSTITIWLARAEIGKFWKHHFHLVGEISNAFRAFSSSSRNYKLFMTFTNFLLWSNYEVVWSLMKLERDWKREH